MTAFHEIRVEPSGEPRRVAVLLTSAGQRVALVHSLRSIGAALGLKVRVIACDRSPRNRPACLVADAAYQTADPGSPGYIDAMLEICVVHRVQLIIPTDSAEMMALSRSRERFAALGVSIAGSGPELVALTHDPAHVRALAARVRPGQASHAENPEIFLSDAGERRFEVLMYFDCGGILRSVIPCERVVQDGIEHLITRHCPELESLAEALARQLDEPRSVVSFDARLSPSGMIHIDELRTHLGESFEIAHLAGAQLIRWLLSEHCFGEGAPTTEWQEGVEMFRYEASMFVLPR